MAAKSGSARCFALGPVCRCVISTIVLPEVTMVHSPTAAALRTILWPGRRAAQRGRIWTGARLRFSWGSWLRVIPTKPPVPAHWIAVNLW